MACGFTFQLLLYALYIVAGVVVVALEGPSAADGGPSAMCAVNVKIYAL